MASKTSKNLEENTTTKVNLYFSNIRMTCKHRSLFIEPFRNHTRINILLNNEVIAM